MLPVSGRPRVTQSEVRSLIAPHHLDRQVYPVVCVGVRGYYRDTMGASGANDRGIYDDCIALDTPSAFLACNGNTDPSVTRPGIATLAPGCWLVHRLDLHRGQYLALCQRAGNVAVSRDGRTAFDVGAFGINIHRGSRTSTSSEGCQTIHPDQWDAFIALARSEAERYRGRAWRELVIPYVLIDGPIR